MEGIVLALCLTAALFYSAEMVTQERKLPDVTPIVVTFVLGVGVALYGLPLVIAEVIMGSAKLPMGWEWALIFVIPVVAFLADWSHFTAIHARVGAVVLATMYITIPVFTSILKLELPSAMRLGSWLLTGMALFVLVRGRIFIETEGSETTPKTRKAVGIGAMMALLATFLYSAEIVIQDKFLSHVSSSILATTGGFATSIYAALIILVKKVQRKELKFPQRKEWRWVIVIPIMSFTADLAHFGALHVKAGSVLLSMFYVTCPIWASLLSWKRPTHWHIWAWVLAIVGILLLIV